MILKAGILWLILLQSGCSLPYRKLPFTTGFEKDLSICQRVNPGYPRFPVLFCESDNYYYIYNSKLPWLEIEKKNYQKLIRFHIQRLLVKSGILPEDSGFTEISLWIRTGIWQQSSPELVAVAGRFIFRLGKLPDLKNPDSSDVSVIRPFVKNLSFPDYKGTETSRLEISLKGPEYSADARHLLKTAFPEITMTRSSGLRIDIRVPPFNARSTGQALLSHPDFRDMIETVWFRNTRARSSDYKKVAKISF